MVLPQSVLEAAKGATVVHVFGDRGVIGDYIVKCSAELSGWPLMVIWSGLYTACGEFW